MQGIGIAISGDGISALLQGGVGDEIASTLQTNLEAPGTVGDVTGITAPQWGYGTAGLSYVYTGYELSLTNGVFTTYSPSFSSFAQDGSAFELTFDAPETIVGYIWDETCTEQISGSGVHHSTNSIGPTSYPYSQSISTFDVPVNVDITYDDTTQQYVLTPSVNQIDTGVESATIPSQSVLNNGGSPGCWDTEANSQANGALSDIDYTSAVQSALANVLGSIPATGMLDDDVTFLFDPAGAALYPAPPDQGVQLGVTGDVQSGSTTWSSVTAPPADVALPDIPATHVAYNIQDWAVNGLLWGYQQAGALDLTLTQSDLPSSDQYILETSSYAGTSLNALDQPPYMNQPMTAAVTPQGVPTVTFQDVWMVTADAITQIQATLTSEGVWTSAMDTALTNLENDMYIDESAFAGAVTGECAALASYMDTVEQYCVSTAGVVSWSVQCVLNVLLEPPVAVLTWDVTQQWVMQDLAIGEPGAQAQSLTFNATIPSGAPAVTTFVSSNLSGVDADSWMSVWFGLQSSWNTAIDGVGQQGVALPRLQGFEFVTDSATVTIFAAEGSTDGYASVLADIEYVPPS